MQATKDVSLSGVFSDADSVHEHFQALVYVSCTAITTVGDPYRGWPVGGVGVYDVTVTDGSNDGRSHGGL